MRVYTRVFYGLGEPIWQQMGKQYVSDGMVESKWAYHVQVMDNSNISMVFYGNMYGPRPVIKP
jgi:hypothetical protein